MNQWVLQQTGGPQVHNLRMPKTVDNLEGPAEKAVLVVGNEDESEDLPVEEELEGLCEAAHVEPVASIRQRLDRPYKTNYVGSGKADEIAALVADADANVVIVDGELTGIQSRNLAEACKCKVVDRTALIL